MAAAEAEAVVVGAGAAGLAAAHGLRGGGVEPLVLEAAERPGGALHTERVGDWLVERGANTLRVKAPALALLRRLGLDRTLLPAAPANRLRFLVQGGRLEPLPRGPVSAVRTPLLSARGKLRLLAEPFVRRGDAAGESVAEFVARRLGPEASERLVGPFLTGVYAGDERRLGAEAVFPALVRHEREHGSIVRGALASRGAGPRGLSGIHSTAHGLGGLAADLAGGLGDALRLGARVTGLAREDGVWRLEGAGLGEGGGLRTRRLLLALPAAAAAALLEAPAPDLAARLRGIAYAPIVSLSAGVARADLARPAEGFGFLVPRAEGLRLLGCLYMSNLFPGRAPEGHVLLTCMLGGVRWSEAVEADDAALREAAARDLAAVLGLRGEPAWLGIARWPRAVAQPGPDHPQRVDAVRAQAARLAADGPALALAGAWLDGVGVPDAMAAGLAAADRLVN